MKSHRQIQAVNLELIIVLTIAIALVGLDVQAKEASERHSRPLKIAKKVKSKSKKNSANSLKAEFKKWFDNFFSRLYYSKDLSEVRPYYSSRFMKGYHRIPADLRGKQLEKLKRQYVGKPKIAKVTMHPGGNSCDVKIEGIVPVYKHRGYGYGIYRMVKEDSIWRIDSAAHRGKAYVH